MEVEGSGRQGPPDGDNDNVVRFPRGWVEPREELVPLGPAADLAARRELRTLQGKPQTLDPNSFWGEDAASLHAAVKPAVGQPTPTQDPRPLDRLADAAETVAAAEADANGAVPATGADAAVHAGVSGALARVAAGVPRPAARGLRSRGIVACAVASLVVAVIWMTTTSGAPSGAKGPGTTSAATIRPATQAQTHARTDRARRSRAASGTRRAAHRSGRRRSRAGTGHSRPARNRSSRAGGKRSIRRTSSPTAARAVNTATPSPSTSSTSELVRGAAAPTDNSAGGSTKASAAKQHSGPTGPGAPFGPGEQQ